MSTEGRRQKSEGRMERQETACAGHIKCQMPYVGCEKCGHVRCTLRVVDSDLGRFVALSPGDSFLCS
jgi:hypothetical protein